MCVGLQVLSAGHAAPKTHFVRKQHRMIVTDSQGGH